MTDWERVDRLRARGTSWDEIAVDNKVGYQAQEGTNPGRALKAQFYLRKSKSQESRFGGRTGLRPANSGFNRSGLSPRTRWGITLGAAAATVLIVGVVLLLPSHPMPGTNPGPAAAGTMDEFNFLAPMHTDACHWPGVNLGDQTAQVNWVFSQPDGTYLQGACCTPMDYSDYARQTHSLATNYTSLAGLVAPDPYNTPSSVAKTDVSYVNLAMTAGQVSVLSNASSMTSDHGWCCCQCWAYYAHEGMAKELIVQYGYDAEQAAQAVNLEDCCGGPGQMNM